MTHKQNNEPKQPSVWILVVAGMMVLATWGGNWWFAKAQFSGPTEAGTFGDMFGAVNALFSGFAFAGLIYTIYLQRKELELQRLELRDTRLELSRSALAQEKSEQALREQVESALLGHRISALNNMLSFANDCYDFRANPEKYKAMNFSVKEQLEIGQWITRRPELLLELERIYFTLFRSPEPNSEEEYDSEEAELGGHSKPG